MGGVYSSAAAPNDKSVASQATSSLLTIFIVASVVVFLQFVFFLTTSKSLNFITLVDKTILSSSGMVTISQNPNIAESIPLGISVNEKTGIEFAYSFYLFVNSDTFDGTDSLKHIFHKGYTKAWPLIGPGVFMLGTTNTMRVVMNTQTSPFTYVDVTNIPVKKWVHVVLNCYKSGVDIYINGNLATRLPLKGTMPYQNFQNVVIFSEANHQTYYKSQIPSLPMDVTFGGKMSGQLSSLKYARYALSINEINALMMQGPSKNVTVSTIETPPYNGDTWWTEQH